MFLFILLFFISLAQAESVVIIKAEPAESEVYINGELKGRFTPLALSLPPGLYQLTLKDREGKLNPVEKTLLVGVMQETVSLALEQNYQEPITGLELAWIKKGCFQMGSPSNESGRDVDEQQHQVCIEENFHISTTEVTFAQYDRFAKATNRALPADEGWGRGERPVINVSWQDAVAFSEWLSAETGDQYRLPTEAEWEYAARAGTTTAFWWGDQAPVCQMGAKNGAKFDDNNRCNDTGPEAVKTYQANPWGLYDVHGNAWEWTASCYAHNYDGRELESAMKAEICNRVIRGGSWYSYPNFLLRSASRAGNSAGVQSQHYGFRVIRMP